MAIAIHARTNSYSDKWISWCKEKCVPHKLVRAYDNDIIDKVSSASAFMWHWHHGNHADQLFARQLMLSLQTIGIPTFPDVKTCWHFDDKLGQKYLLESLGLPLVRAHAFFDREEAEAWLKTVQFPIVTKLRGGAGAVNVSLIGDISEAHSLLDKSFGAGHKSFSFQSRIKESWLRCKASPSIKNLTSLALWAGRMAINARPLGAFYTPVQNGYVYFQDFVPGNSYDDRLVVIGDRCFGMRRYCRQNDFRASGSGLKNYDIRQIPLESIELAFKTARSLGSQSVAMDIVYDEQKHPKLIELSYCFTSRDSYSDFQGYYDSGLNWCDKPVEPEVFMIEDLAKRAGIVY